MLDWTREFATCDPGYYKHQLNVPSTFGADWSSGGNEVNWDPVDQTVLANEQVIDGRGWRSGAIVEHRELTQWFIKITEYARPPGRAETLDRWPDKVRLMQRTGSAVPRACWCASRST